MTKPAQGFQFGFTPTLGDRLSTTARLPLWGLIGLNLALLGLVSFSQGGDVLPWRHCPFQWVFGFPSPGCGLTRSLLALSQGHWQLALSYHLFGPLVWCFCGLAGFKAALELTLGRSLQFAFQPPLSQIVEQLWCWRSLRLLGGLFLTYYLVRLYVRFAIVTGPGIESAAWWRWFVWGTQAL